MAIYKIKRFSISSFFHSMKDKWKKANEDYKKLEKRKNNPFYNPFEDISEGEIMEQVKSNLPKEYYSLLKVQDEANKYRKTHNLDYLDLDVGFPDIYIESINDIVKDLKSGRGYSSEHQYKIGILDSELYTLLYFDVSDKKWFFLQSEPKYLVNLKQSIINHYKQLLFEWLKDPNGWLDEEELKNMKNYTEYLISLVQRYL